MSEWALTIFIAFVVGFLAFGLGCSLTHDRWRNDAVAHGKAEFYLNEHNNRQCRWKP